MKGTHDVLDSSKVDGGFAADGRIDLRKEGGGYVVKADAAHKCSCSKTRHIAHNAAADSYYSIAAGKTAVDQLLQYPAVNIYVFTRFTLRESECDGVGNATLERISHCNGIYRGYAAVGYNEHLAAFYSELPAGIGQRAAPYNDIITGHF